jgi:aspartate/methionine/tyrosine aminotransferase
MPLQHVAIAAYQDEAHVDENRRLYGIKFDLADEILGNRFGYQRPAGGFCAWLDVSAHGGDEAATVKLFRDGGVRVLPGSYLARAQSDGSNPGAGYIRVALVQDAKSTTQALQRMVQVLNDNEPRS